MITDLAIDVNNFTFVVNNDAMYIDIRPEDNLQPQALKADEQPALVYLAGLGKSSQRTMYGALVLIAGILSRGQCSPLTLPWHRLRRSHVIAIRAWLIEHRSAATGQRMIAALKGTLKEAWRMGQMATDDYARAVDIKPIRGTGREEAAGRALSQGEKSAILAVLGSSSKPVDVRNAAIFGLAVYGGLRRAEIAALRLDSYDRDTGAIHLIGKGNKTRTIYAAPGVDDALADWLHLRGDADGFLFTRVLKSGRVLDVGMSAEAIYQVMETLQVQAKIKPFSPHDLRRTFAGDLLDEGADISTVQKLMGHASATTTAKYDRRGERAKQKAISKLHMAYQRKFQEK